MKQEIFTIEDMVAKKYNTPFFSDNAQTAIRAVKNAVRNDEGFKTSPQDYRIFRIGTYNMETGVIDALDNPEYLISVNELVEPEVN